MNDFDVENVSYLYFVLKLFIFIFKIDDAFPYLITFCAGCTELIRFYMLTVFKVGIFLRRIQNVVESTIQVLFSAVFAYAGSALFLHKHLSNKNAFAFQRFLKFSFLK